MTLWDSVTVLVHYVLAFDADTVLAHQWSHGEKKKNVSAVIVSSALVTALITTVSIGRLRPRCGTLWQYCCYYVADTEMIPAHQWNKNVITLTPLSSLPAKNYNLPCSQWGKCRQNNIFVSEILAALLQLAFVRYRAQFGILWYVQVTTAIIGPLPVRFWHTTEAEIS